MELGTTTITVTGDIGGENRAEKRERDDGRHGDGRWQKGCSGNPTGPKPGFRHKITKAVENLLGGQAEAITQRAIEKALEGDTVALRLCLDRLAPPRRTPSVDVELPPLETPADAIKAMSALAAAVTSGSISPSEAAELGKLVDSFVRAIETHDLAERIAALEAKK